MLNFDLREKVLELVALSHFVYDFSRKIFLVFYSMNCSNFIVRLPLRFELLGNMCIVIVSQFVTSQLLTSTLAYQAIFLHDQKSWNKNLNIFRTKRAFQVK